MSVFLLHCRAYIRYLGVSVHQPIHIQDCGDFNIDRIEVAEAPCSSGCRPAANELQSMEMAGSGARVLAVADPGARQGVVRLNSPDPLAGEQTWPTNEVSHMGPCSLLYHFMLLVIYTCRTEANVFMLGIKPCIMCKQLLQLRSSATNAIFLKALILSRCTNVWAHPEDLQTVSQSAD